MMFLTKISQDHFKMQQKILILGISSFAGASFANFILNKRKKFKVFGTFNNAKSFPIRSLLDNQKLKKIKLYRLNLNKNNKLLSFVKKIEPDYIFDFASICMVNESWSNPSYYFQVNVNSKIEFIKNIDQLKKIKKFIYISTPEIFGSNTKKITEKMINFNPTTPYASSKLSAEMFLNNYINDKNYKIIICRFSNFYGRGQPLYRLIPKLIWCLNNNKKFPLHGTGDTKRDFLFDEDFNNGLFKVLNKGKIGSKYHFSGKKFYKVKEVINKLLSIKGMKFNDCIKFTKDRKGKDQNYFLDCEFTKKEINWDPKINLINGLKKTIKFYENKNLIIKKKDLKFSIK